MLFVVGIVGNRYCSVFGNFRDHILLFVLGIVGNCLCFVLWEL